MVTNSTPKFGKGESDYEVTSRVDVELVVLGFVELFDSIRLVAPDDQFNGAGRKFLAGAVRSIVEEGRRIALVLPAFPAKSPNVTKKVLGVLPDRGEELALGVLEQFCRDIETFYPPGAEVVIFSDGRVFSDLLNISSETVDAYQQECERMVADAGYTHITFDNLENHLGKDCEPQASVDQVVLMDRLLEAYGDPALDAHLENDADLAELQQSIKCFLRLDLEPSKDTFLSELAGASQKKLQAAFKQKCGQVAKAMIIRNTAFSKLVNAAHPGVVRISIHAHNNAGPNFGVCLFPKQGPRTTPHTPWHSVVVETSDGQIQLMRRELVDLSKFEVYEHPIYKRAWGFREKVTGNNVAYHTSVDDVENLLNVSSEAGVCKILDESDVTFLAGLPIEIKRLNPCGIILHCVDGAAPLTPLDIAPDTLRRLTLQFGVVVLRGFQEVKSVGDKLVKVAARIGEIVYWSDFGAVLDDVEEVQGTEGSVKSPQAQAFQWDGAFKFHNSQLQEIPHADTPGFILFHCVKAPVGGGKGGEAIMTDCRRVLRSGKLAMADLASLEAEYYSPASGNVGGRWVQHKFVAPHPITGEPTLRYLEPCPESKSAKQRTEMRAVRESDTARVVEVSKLVREQIYDEEMFCYRHSWRSNDFVFVDNHAMLHGQTSSTEGSHCHIRRVHFN